MTADSTINEARELQKWCESRLGDGEWGHHMQQHFQRMARCLSGLIALRTASAEPSPEVNVEARGLPPLSSFSFGALGDLTGSGLGALVQNYALAALAAQADARREDGAMLAAIRRGMAAHGLQQRDMADSILAEIAAMNTTKGEDHAE